MDRKKIRNFFKLGNKELIKEGVSKIYFTEEEKRIIRCLIEENSDIEISLKLNCSLRTLQRRKKKIYDKTYNSLKEWDKLKGLI